MPVPDARGHGAYKPMSARIDWGYHARLPTGGGRLVAAAVVFAGAAWAALSLCGPTPLDPLASPGPVARVHQRWENDCAKCHTPFTPIGSAAGSGRCTDCHAGPPHHPNETHAPACAECHFDHQGRDGALTRPADAACTRCHADLGAHHRQPDQIRKGASAIRSFAGPANGHPEFRVLDGPARPRQLKFSHAIHLTPGMGKGFAYAEMAKPDRERYLALTGAAAATSPVALNCAACHALDAGRTDATGATAAVPRTPAERFAAGFDPAAFALPREAARPPRADGRAHLPIVYEAHCLACHPLAFLPAFPVVEVPHRLQPDRVDDFLRRVYADRWVTGGVAGAPPGGVANDRLDPRWPAVPAKAPATVGEAIADRVADAQGILYDGGRVCLHCHTAELPAPKAGGDGKPVRPVRIIPADIPTVWMPRAGFSHAAHRNETCARCHVAGSGRSRDEERHAAVAGAAGSADPHFQHPPDLPGIDTCRTCHTPAGRAVTGCTDCHSYHAIDRPFQGIGAKTHHPSAADRR